MILKFDYVKQKLVLFLTIIMIIIQLLIMMGRIRKFEGFKSSLKSILQKKNLTKTISEKKNIIIYEELKEYQRPEEGKIIYNKFKARITGGILKKSLEKN